MWRCSSLTLLRAGCNFFNRIVSKFATMELTESQRITAILQGRVHLFDAFVEQYSERVRRLVCGIMGDDPAVPDIVQDIFVRAYMGLGSFSGRSSFGTWIYRIAWNTTLTAAKTGRGREIPSSDKESAWDNLPETDDQEIGEERLELLTRALATLSVDDRALVTLFYLEEKSVREVSAVTGLTESNIKVRLHRIRKKLYYLITEYEKE